MSELQGLITSLYDQAKSGYWDRVLSEWKELPLIARRCSRFQKSSSGWTFLHQAAFFGNQDACLELIRLGASTGNPSHDGKTAADIALEKGHTTLASQLRRALQDKDSLWVASADPDLLPCSNLWGEAVEHRAHEVLLVAYAGGVVRIPLGARYFTDSFARILVGWHGTYDPPCGMDGESIL